MALTKKDLKDIKEVVGQTIDDRLRINTDILMQELRASEHRLEQKIVSVKGELHQDIRQTEERILAGVAEMIDQDILPQLDDHDVKIKKLEAKIA